MKATIPYIERKFDEFNRKMFAGKLPRIPIELSDAKTFLGVCAFQKRRLPNGMTECYNFRLRINTRIDLPEREIEDTIIHEMIHYYIGFNHLEDSSSHGHIFQRLMNDINKRHGRHLNISHKGTAEQIEQTYDTKQHWHVVAVVSMANGKTGLKVLPRISPKILNYFNQISASNMVKSIKLFMSNDIFFNRFPNSSALNVCYVDYEEVMAHLQGAEELKCDGKQLISNDHAQEHQPSGERTNLPKYHVIAVLSLEDQQTGIKVLPRVLSTILKYYNDIKVFHNVKSVELYMSNDPYFEKYPNSGKLSYHPEDKERVMAHLKNAKHLKCDGSKIIDC